MIICALFEISKREGKDMRKIVTACFAVLVASVFVSGVYAQTNNSQANQNRRAEIKQEMDSERADAKTFHDSLKKMSAKDRKAAITSFRASQAAKRKAFRDKMQSEMKSEMQNNAASTPAANTHPTPRPRPTGATPRPIGAAPRVHPITPRVVPTPEAAPKQ